MKGDRVIRLLVVEDHRLMFEGLTSLLGEYSDLSVLGVATTVADAVAKSLFLKPDLVLMDYRLPDGDGAQATEKIRSSLPETAVVFLSADVSEASMMRAVEAGAAGYVSKGASAEELVSAVRRAADGEFLVGASTMSRLLQQRRAAEKRNAMQARIGNELTPREREVLNLMAGGFDNYDIASELRIGYGTVRGHVRGVLEKLGAHSKLQAVATARQAGLVES
ncbi:MAG TPA: response regulator transcription factor [Variovorax sp.]|nr:response regulator transcription factor [Variovorax sp.]